jgi:hypothetical protein
LVIADPGANKPCELARVSLKGDQRNLLPAVNLVVNEPPSIIAARLIEVIDVKDDGPKPKSVITTPEKPVENPPAVAPAPSTSPKAEKFDEEQLKADQERADREKKRIAREREREREKERARAEARAEERAEERREQKRAEQRRAQRRKERQEEAKKQQQPPPVLDKCTAPDDQVNWMDKLACKVKGQ